VKETPLSRLDANALDTNDWLVRLDVPRALSSSGVQIWLVHLDLPESLISDLRGLLSPEESQRAARFLVEPPRRSFVVSRAALRLVLGRRLATNPFQLRFTYSVSGKPSLSSEQGRPPLCFNLSHSGGLALIAVAHDQEVGVDIELAKERSDLYESAGDFLAPGEHALLRQAAASERGALFYRIWTRKEAVLKGHGQGIAGGLHLPDLSGMPAGPGSHAVIEFAGAPWLVSDLEPATGYQGALALRAAHFH